MGEQAGRGRHVPPGPEMEMQPPSAEARVTAGVLATWVFAPWHMAAWWRHVLLSRMHQRAAPRYPIVPIYISHRFPAHVFHLKVRCDYVQAASVPQKNEAELRMVEGRVRCF